MVFQNRGSLSRRASVASSIGWRQRDTIQRWMHVQCETTFLRGLGPLNPFVKIHAICNLDRRISRSKINGAGGARGWGVGLRGGKWSTGGTK